MTAIGIDVGSTSIKGALLAPDGMILGQIERIDFPNHVSGLPNGYFEINPSDVFFGIDLLVKKLINISPNAKSLYISGQMGGAMLCNERGEPQTRYISWRDQRSLVKDECGNCLIDSLRDKLGIDTLSQLGQELKPGSTTILLHVLAQSFGVTRRLYPATIADGVAAYLCRQSPRMHPTMAIGMLDLTRSSPTWHGGMIDLLRLGDLEWPTLAQLNKPYGEAVVNGVTLKVFPAVGDQQSALMGAGLLENELSLNISTGAQVSQIVDQMSVGSHQTRYFFNGKLLETITHIPAGRSLHSIVEVLTEISRSQGLPLGDPWKTMIRLMNESEKFTSNGKLEFGLSFFPSPVGSEGFIRGITLENFSVGKLMLAAVKNLADNLTKCSSILNPNHTWSNVRISGGLSHSLPQLVEYLGSYFGANRISESVVDEETLVGLATLAYSTDFAHANKDGHNVPRQ